MIALMTLMLAAQAASPAPVAPKKAGADKLICVQAQEIGTRLAGHRICRTKAEWDQDRHDVRVDTENAQRTNYH